MQDVLGHRVPDDLALAWAAAEGRLLLTHDGATVPDFAYARIAAGLPMPGVLVLQHDVATAIAVGELTILLAAGKEADFRDFVLRVPLR